MDLEARPIHTCALDGELTTVGSSPDADCCLDIEGWSPVQLALIQEQSGRPFWMSLHNRNCVFEENHAAGGQVTNQLSCDAGNTSCIGWLKFHPLRPDPTSGMRFKTILLADLLEQLE